eukprot:TRINITY_DN30509_c0_g1_i1.p1 TRINITY_DN30509_c0_g1~~TRINITY_DN30509_c0_g1_i1.p1  ORF type:complete len:646 (+),score=106.02 TRINITY_DN30509_c0_g1_i1:148-2085(+)
MAGVLAQAAWFLLAWQLSKADEIHISVRNGCDSRGDGSKAAPYQTLHGGLAAHVRRESGAEELNVVLHEGTYTPFHLEPSFSRLMIFGALGEEQPIINAGKAVPKTAFSRIGSGPLLRADLFDHGVTSDDLGKMVNGGSVGDCQHEKTDLIFAGQRMTLARWPNIDGERWKFANIDMGGSTSVGVNMTLQSEARRIARWEAEIDAWIHGYWTFDWTDSYVRVKNISVNNVMAMMTLEPPTEIKAHARFYGVNLLCELDSPGEYYINQQNGTLYFYPPTAIEEWQESDSVFLTANEFALNMSFASDVKIANLTIANSKGTGLLAKGVRDVRIDNVTSINHGQRGIVIDGYKYQLLNSHVHDIGCVGIQASGGDVLTLTPGSNMIHGNTVRRPALWKRTYMAGIKWGGVNNTFSRNLVSDGPHNCVLGGGNELAAVDCLHEDNVIENCAYESSDTGAWYSCGQNGAWINRGNVARGNHFRHIRCGISGRSVEGCGGGVQAVYLDDQMSGWLWENNTFQDCDTALFIGGGRDNWLVGNKIYNSSLAVHIDNRGMTWENKQCCSKCKSWKEVEALLQGPAAQRWAQGWPDLLSIIHENHLCVPVYNHIVNNTYSNTSRFIDASASSVRAWLGVLEGNVNASAVSLELFV